MAKKKQDNQANMWLSTALLLLLIVVAYLVYSYIDFSQFQQQPTPPVDDRPVVTDELREEELGGPAVFEDVPEKLDDIAEAIEEKPVPNPTIKRIVADYEDDEHIRGDRNAPYSIMEYSSIHNTYSSLIHPAMHELVQRRPEVNWVWRHFPVNSPHDYEGAEAAECIYQAADDDHFWDYLDRILNQNDISENIVLETALATGVDRDAFVRCMQRNAGESPVIIDKQEGLFDVRVSAVPSFVFRNNQTGEIRFVEGVNTVQYMEEVLDAMIGG